jgi:pimeloyl-ACP methyl ester carboxylesterase
VNENIGFLLLSGGGMSSWLWDKVVPLLLAPVITPQYRLKENNEVLRRTAKISDCVNHCVELINKSKYEKIIIVGHSGTGGLAKAIGKDIPEKVKAIIYISASIPKNHQSAIDSIPLILRVINKRAIENQVKVEMTSMQNKKKMIKKYFCNASDDETLNYVLSHDLLSEPLCLAFEKYNFDNYPSIRQAYIVLTDDMTHTIKHQKEMMDNWGIREYYEIAADHLVMLSKPEDTAKVLNKFI